MCGIAGVRQFGTNPITREELVLLLCELEHRGNHATGIALLNEDGVKVHKAAVPAWEFTKSKEFDEFLKEYLSEKTQTALLHTRFATVGNPEFNQNNHPIWDGRTAIVHNGHISNHLHLFQANKLKRVAETDSDIIRAMVHEYGMTAKCVRELSKMGGSAAIACIDADTPETLLLARSGSPLIIGFPPDASKLYWASESRAILKASRPFKQVYGVWVQEARSNISLASMPDNTAWIFNKDGLQTHAEFPVCVSYRAPDYKGMSTSYHEKTKRFKGEAKAKKKRENEEAESQERIAKVIARGEELMRPTTRPQLHSAVNRPLPGSLATCSACGCAVMNKNGVPWEIIDCPDCGRRVMPEED